MNDLLLPAIQKSAQDLDPYYNLVSLHLKGDVNTGRNYNAFSDASSNNFRLTNSGDVRGSSFSPYGTSWSNSFNGSSATTVTTTAAFAAANEDFTIECWVYRASITSQMICGYNNSPAFDYFLLGGTGNIQLNANNTYTIDTGALSWQVNTWYHIAISRVSGVVKIFRDGNQVGSNVSNSNSFGVAGDIRIADWFTTPRYYFSGYISNFRFVKGIGVYTGNFNVPTSPLGLTQSAGTNIQAIAGSQTKLLTCQGNRFIDASGNATSVTVQAGSPTVSSFSPFLETDTTSGSGYFDGTGDFLSATVTASDFYTDLGDFTFEGWVYPLSFSGPQYSCPLFAFSSDDLMLRAMPTSATSTSLNIYGITSAGGAAFGSAGTSGGTIRLNEWAWVVFTRESGVLNLWVNGTRVVNNSTYTSTQLRQTATSLRIGGAFAGTPAPLWNGYLSGIKWTSGAALYSGATISMPTAPATTSVSSGTLRLLTLQERGAYNTIGFQDESEYQHIITRSGNVAQGTFSPFSNAGWSSYSAGESGNYWTVSGGMPSGQGTAFSLECWIYLNNLSAYRTISRGTSSGSLDIGVTTAGTLTIDNTNVTNIVSSVTGAVQVNRWHHVLITRTTGNVYTVYIDGIGGTPSGAYNTSMTANTTIGYNSFSQTYNFSGYISNLRVTNTVIQSGNFNPPTQPLTAITGTQLLIFQNNRFVDNSSSPKTIAANGSPIVAAFSPFKPTAYDPQVHGGSGYFDGTGDYLTIVDNSAFTLANYNFCIELWIYPTASMANYANFLGQWANSTTNCAYTFRTSVSQNVQFAYTTSGNGQAGTTVDGSALVISSWNHIVVCRNGTTLSIFQNGVRTATHNISTNTISDSSRDQQIGFGTDGSAITGYMSSLRFVTGNSIYDPTLTSITVPSGPLPILPNTGLLLNFTNAGVIDSTGKNVIETYGNAGVVTTSIKKYGTGSMYFDGTGDYLFASPSQNFSFGTGDFTIEAWFYTAVGTNNAIFQISNTAGGFHTNYTNTIAIGLLSGKLNLFGVAGTGITSTGASYATSSWVHVALVRSSGVTKLYLNGTLDTTVGTSGSITDTTNYTMQYIIVGGYFSTSYLWNGYIDDLRITRGLARYTANFTPPTKALPDRGILSTLTTDMAAPSSVEALVVAGGGSGGASPNATGNQRTGGGGAGGFREFVGGNAIAVSGSTNYTLSVGLGGTAPTGAVYGGTKGGDSIFHNITSIGGGAGNGQGVAGGNGGSGGGGGADPTTAGLGTAGQGNNGAAGTGYNGTGGGGGGAGAAATNANGGNGATSSITGTLVTYAGGGGAGGSAGTGGTGGGGAGAANGAVATSGTANTGGGGGGGQGASTAGSGGSGVVILAYPTSFRPLKASLGLVYTIDTVTRPGYRVYRFTSGSGNISW